MLLRKGHKFAHHLQNKPLHVYELKIQGLHDELTKADRAFFTHDNNRKNAHHVVNTLGQAGAMAVSKVLSEGPTEGLKWLSVKGLVALATSPLRLIEKGIDMLTGKSWEDSKAHLSDAIGAFVAAAVTVAVKAVFEALELLAHGAIYLGGKAVAYGHKLIMNIGHGAKELVGMLRYAKDDVVRDVSDFAGRVEFQSPVHLKPADAEDVREEFLLNSELYPKAYAQHLAAQRGDTDQAVWI